MVCCLYLALVMGSDCAVSLVFVVVGGGGGVVDVIVAVDIVLQFTFSLLFK